MKPAKPVLAFLLLFVMTQLSGCAPIWEDWEVFEHPFEPFPEALVFEMEYSTYPGNARFIRATLYNRSDNQFDLLSPAFIGRIYLVKRVGDSWRYVPGDMILFDGPYGLMPPGERGMTFTVTNDYFDRNAPVTTYLYTNRSSLPAGTYRIVKHVGFGQPGSTFRWSGPVWAEFEVVR